MARALLILAGLAVLAVLLLIVDYGCNIATGESVVARWRRRHDRQKAKRRFLNSLQYRNPTELRK